MKTNRRTLNVIVIIALVSLIHIVLLISITIKKMRKEERAVATIFKMVDIREILPPPEEKDIMEIEQQESVTENVLETDKVIKEREIQYLPQHLTSVVPILPTKRLLDSIIYPPLANRQGIEGTVFLLLYIDKKGIIRNIEVLKDPGYGFAEAAIKALNGITCIPAQSNGEAVPVMYRYPVRFKLKK